MPPNERRSYEYKNFRNKITNNIWKWFVCSYRRKYKRKNTNRTGYLELEEDCIFNINRSNDTLKYDKDYDAYISVKVQNEQPTVTLEIKRLRWWRNNL